MSICWKSTTQTSVNSVNYIFLTFITWQIWFNKIISLYCWTHGTENYLCEKIFFTSILHVSESLNCLFKKKFLLLVLPDQNMFWILLSYVLSAVSRRLNVEITFAFQLSKVTSAPYPLNSTVMWRNTGQGTKRITGLARDVAFDWVNFTDTWLPISKR